MEVSSSSHQPISNFHWDRDDLNTTATTSTAVMPPPVLLSHPDAVDNTLTLDPSFVDVDHYPDLGRKTPVPSRGGSHAKRKASTATATVSGATASSSASASGGSKLRSVSTPTPPTSVHPAPRSSSKSRGHRSTKSHGNPHDEHHIQDDLLLNLLKEFRAAKKKERDRDGAMTDSGTGSVSLSLGVKSLLSHGSRRPQLAAQDRDHPHSSPPSYDSTTRPPTHKTRERSASSASISTPPKSRPRAKSTSSSSTEVVLLLATLRQETSRANALEAQYNELLERYNIMRQGKLNAEAQLAVIREELRLYKEQLDLAQKEIFRAQQIVDSVDRQRVLAEQEAQRNREKARKYLEERLVAQALEEGRREGYEEGMRRGRLAREEQERQIEEEREREREKRRREKERERARREEERLEREREREEEERRQRERERLEQERRERVRVELERLRRDREEREKRERERMEEFRRERERQEEEQRQRLRQEEQLRRQEEESRRREYEEWDRKTKHQLTQRVRSNTLSGATTNPNTNSSHRSRARSGSVPSFSRPPNTLTPPPRPSSPPLPPPPPAKSTPPEHREIRSRTPAPQPRSRTPAPGSSTTPAGNPPSNHARRPSPPSSGETIQYVPLPQPPPNYIPVAKKDGPVPIPPPFGFKSPPRNDTSARPPRPSSRAGTAHGFANPDRERMRQMIIGAGNPETPTPKPPITSARPFSRQGDPKGKGKMRVVNEEIVQPPKTYDSPSGFPWNAPASPVVIPTIESPTPPSSDRSPPRASSVTPAMFMSTPMKKGGSPPPPDPNMSTRSSGEESKWLLPPDFSYAGGQPTMTPMLVRSATSGTAPTIGIEPPSHSPTTEGDSSRAYDSGLLTPAGNVAHHEREPEEHEYESTTSPQSYNYQPPMPTPVYSQPPGSNAAPWNYTSPPHGQPPQYQRYDYSGNSNSAHSPQWMVRPGSQGTDKGDQWVPPPVIPLSPIPGSIKSMDYKFAAAPSSSSVESPRRAMSPGSENTDNEPLNFGMVGMTSMATSKFLSPGRLDRPISLFSDSDG